MDFGCLKYWTTNIGDEIQTLAALNFLPPDVRFLDRDDLGAERLEREHFLICHGWWMHGRGGAFRFPPPALIRPWFVSLHLAPEFQSRSDAAAIDYLRQHAPIGCRDRFTLRFLKERGLPCYYSGCLTLTLGLFAPRDVARTPEVCVVDAAPWAVEQLPASIVSRAVWLTHNHPRAPNPRWETSANLAERHSLAKQILQRYQRASLVITGRLHCALPALALGTPVIFVPKNPGDPRYEGLRDTLTVYEPGSSIQWNVQPKDISKDAVPLYHLIRDAVAIQGNPIEKPEQYPTAYSIRSTGSQRQRHLTASTSFSGHHADSPVQDSPHIVFLNVDIKKVRTGIENAALLRARIFHEHLGVRPWIATANYDAHFADTRAELIRLGKVRADTIFVNLYSFFQESADTGCHAASPEHLLNRFWRYEPVVNTHDARVFDGHGDLLMYVKRCSRGTYTEYINHFINRRMWRRDTFATNGDLSRIQYLDTETRNPIFECYLRPDGSPAIVQLFSGPANQRRICKISLLSREGLTVAEFNNRDDLVTYWLDQLTWNVNERWVLFCDKNRIYYKSLRHLRKLPGKLNIQVVPVIHAVHTKSGFDVKRSRTNANYTDILQDITFPDALVVATEKQRRDIIERYGNGRIHVIPPACCESNGKAKAGFTSRQRTKVVYLGRYSPEKQQPVAVRAFAKVLQVVPDAELHFYGSGNGKAELDKLIRELGLTKSVFAHSFVADVNAIYRTAGLSLLTSMGEGYSLVIMESLSHGCPVVAFDVNYGPADMIQDRVTGALVPYGDEVALANRIIEILQDPGLHERMCHSAEMAAREFSAQAVGDKWKKLLVGLTRGEDNP